MNLILLLCMVERILGYASGRRHDRDKAEKAFVANMARLSLCTTECLPHSDTLRYFLKNCRVRELGNVPPMMFGHLLRTKRLNGLRSSAAPVNGEPSFLVAVDGVCWFTCGSPVAHSIHKTFRDGRTVYGLTALQATVVSASGIRIPLMTEFIENDGTSEYDKQDCEQKAALRLLKRLKEAFPHLRMTILMDGLHLCEAVVKACGENKWNFSVTVTDSVSAFKRKAEKAMKERGHHADGDDGKTGLHRKVHWCNKVEHRFGGTTVALNVIKMETTNDRGEDVVLFYATNIFLPGKEDKALRVLDEACRARWQIEESFDSQKHHGLGLEAVLGTRGNTGQNYYLIVQIADIIRTFMLHSSLFRRLQLEENPGWAKEPVRRPMLEWYGTLSILVERLRCSFRTVPMSDLDISGWRLECDTA